MVPTVTSTKMPTIFSTVVPQYDFYIFMRSFA